MSALLREIVSGLASGRAFETSAALFDLAFLVFVATTACYLIFLATRRDGIWKVGFGLASFGTLALSLALVFRWIAAGWDHPPFTNMYESLVFFAWGIVVVYLFVEWRYRVKIAGAFVMPLAAVAMGLASLSPNKEIEPLVPALQSIWLHLHVAVASIGYAAFLTAFVFSVLFLLKDKVRISWFVVVAAAFAVFAALVATKGAVLTKAAYPVTQMVQHAGHWVKVPAPDGQPGSFAQVIVPGAGPLLLLAVILSLAACLAGVREILQNKNTEARLSGHLLLGAFVTLSVTLFWFVSQLGGMPDAHISGNIYTFFMVVTAWLFACLVLVFRWRYTDLMAALPDARTLDDLGYKAVMVGFPLMTLVIVTGAVWANKAWGRPWGWDPKETASLVTWIIYLLYLHTRLTVGWTGRRSNLIAIIGFLSVVFTYLGVNLLLSGLHAYATG
jgi:ABC-type transport system involved in cytochrome c biogenesis permease subunit